MTTPKNRDELRELIARTLYDDTVGGCSSELMDMHAEFSLGQADTILAVLEEAGCAVVPVDATGDMLNAYSSAIHYWLDEIGEDADVFKAMLAASPYRKGDN